MKKLIFSTLLIGLFALAPTHQAYAQDPEFTQFYANPLYLNPAFAGTGRSEALYLEASIPAARKIGNAKSANGSDGCTLSRPRRRKPTWPQDLSLCAVHPMGAVVGESERRLRQLHARVTFSQPVGIPRDGVVAVADSRHY